jgi:signal transduction histidine kinase
MRVIGSLRRSGFEVACALFVGANLAVMFVWPEYIRVPFFLTWLGLTVVYGFRLWSATATTLVVITLSLTTIAVVLADGFEGDELWGKLVTIPLLAAIFIAMAWHARRRAAAQQHAEAVAASRQSLLRRQQQFTFDASHELRTPVTIARGHLELLSRETDAPELAVALDELERMERIVDRLLLLAKAEQPDFVVFGDVDVERFLEDVFMRWSEVAPRAWRLELDVAGVVRVDPEALRTALDALLENAVKYTEPLDGITLRAYALSGELVIEVADEGAGIPENAMESIFDRFARADDARTRAHGGVGLGLAIVAAIARAHGGRCTVERRDGQTIFRLALPVGAEISGGAEELVLVAGNGDRELADQVSLNAVR